MPPLKEFKFNHNEQQVISVRKKVKRIRRTNKELERCIRKMKDEVREAMGLNHKMIPDYAIWSRAISLLKRIK